MRSVTAKWLEAKVKYAKVNEEGVHKKVTETYVVNAITYAEAEKRIHEEISPFSTGDIEILGIKKTAFSEIYFTDLAKDDRFFKAKMKYVTIDENTSKEKKTTMNMIVQSSDIHVALENVCSAMNDSQVEYETPSLSETSYYDVSNKQKKTDYFHKQPEFTKTK